MNALCLLAKLAFARMPAVDAAASLLLVVALALSGCAHQAQGVAVAPGKMFAGDYINIRAPQTDGWQLIHSSGRGMVFGKRSDTPMASFTASVNMFDLAPTKTPEELEILVKDGIAKDSDPTRFEVQEESLKSSTERSYPCVRYQSVVKDKTPKGSTVPLLLEVDGLYCRHPIRQATSFAVVYSYRGVTRRPTLRAEAEAFILGVQVPEK